MIAQVFATLSIGLLIGSVVQTGRELLGIRAGKWLPIIVSLTSLIPVGGLPLGRLGFSFTGPFSTPLVIMLAWFVCQPVVSHNPIPKSTVRWFWAMNVTIGAIYYPAALGVGSLDPHAFGWIPEFVYLPIVLAIFSLWIGQPILAGSYVITFLAWKLHWAETTNGWNYLIDPIAMGTSMLGLASMALSQASRWYRNSTDSIDAVDIEPTAIIEQPAQAA